MRNDKYIDDIQKVFFTNTDIKEGRQCKILFERGKAPDRGEARRS